LLEKLSIRLCGEITIKIITTTKTKKKKSKKSNTFLIILCELRVLCGEKVDRQNYINHQEHEEHEKIILTLFKPSRSS
jgi:hypothetical protein